MSESEVISKTGTSFPCLVFSYDFISECNSHWTYIMHTDAEQTNFNEKRPVNIVYLDLAKEENIKECLRKYNYEKIAILSHDVDSAKAIRLGLIILQNSQPKHIWFVSSRSETSEGFRAFARTIRQETSDINIWCVDLIGHLNFEQIYKTITNAAKPNEFDFRLNKEHILQIPRLVIAKSEANEPFKISSNGTYIISGGLGAIGFVVAKWIISFGASNIVILSRKIPDEKQRDQIESMCRSYNISIKCFSCDIGNRDDVKAILEKLSDLKWPNVRGIIHSAGVLSDGTINNINEEKLSISFKPKVLGAINLHDIFKPSDFLVMFSSAAAVLGSPGQANYATANAVMDGLALKWIENGERILSIQWAAWSDGGMATYNASTLRRFHKLGFGSISNEMGLKILSKLFSQGKQGVVLVAPIDWNLAILHLKSCLFERLNPVVNKHHINHKSNEFIENKENLISIVRYVAEDVIGEQISDEQVLLEVGMDSLGAVEFRNKLSEKLNIQLPSSILFDYPNILSLVSYLKSKSRVENKIERPFKFYNDPILVIGAGLGGLSFAKMLLQAGEKVIIMESNSDIGGVWKTWANSSSKLQIDSPSYDFGCTDLTQVKTWPATYPTRDQILLGAQELCSTLEIQMLKNTQVNRIRPISSSKDEYIVDFITNNTPSQIRVSGVAALTGGLHKPRKLDILGEDQTKIEIAYGINNDVALENFKNSRVVIIGHGAFAIENMRTALENGAEKVTILCRRRNVVFSTICNWILNSSNGNLSIKRVVDILRPMYELIGVDVEKLGCFSIEQGEYMFDQETVPAASDLYFLAQAAGRLEVIEDLPLYLNEHELVTKGGRKIKANIILKCLGFDTKENLLTEMFGNDANVQGIWINGDSNLFSYNDGVQRSRKVRSLLCSSYLYFVQSFALAFIHFRRRPEMLNQTLSKIKQLQNDSELHTQMMVMLWDFLLPAKQALSQRTQHICPFNSFLQEREHDWNRYQHLLRNQTKIDFFNLLKPTINELRRSEPMRLFKEQSVNNKTISVYRSKPKHRVLFLHGQGTDGAIACTLLERCGWFEQFKDQLEFVVPDAPFEMDAFTNKQQLSQIGLDSLVEQHLYNLNLKYKEWNADFDWFADIFNETKNATKKGQEQKWQHIFDYINQITREFGPFDGIAGFCEGASVASVALHIQDLFNRGKQSTIDLGLANVRFFIAMSPWRNPYFETQSLFNHEVPLNIPSLHINGLKDTDMFKKSFPIFMNDFKKPLKYEHNGKHEYPMVSSSLKKTIQELLDHLKE